MRVTGLLLASDLAYAQREYAMIVRTSADHILHIINQVLDFNKLEAGKVEIEHINFDVMDAVEVLLDLMAYAADRKGVRLYATVEPEVPRLVRGDPSRLKQILINLINNAIKFTEKSGQVELRIQCDNSVLLSSDHLCQLRFSVLDNGIGMDDNGLMRLFQPFSQADQSISRRFGGSGLGLKISKQLALLLGGDLVVESSLGVGSVFHTTLPFDRPEPVAAAPVPDASAPSSSSSTAVVPAPLSDNYDDGAHLRDLRVLVVTDSTTSGRVFVLLARHWPCEVSTVGFQEVLSAVRVSLQERHPFDVVILDVPFGLATQIIPSLRSACGPQVYVARTAQFSDRPDQHAANPDAAGSFDDIINLPVKYSTLRDLLGRSRLNRSVSTSPIVSPTKPGPNPGPGPGPTAPSSPSSSGSSISILLVDDNTVNQMVAKRALLKLGYQSVDSAANGLEALEAARLINYDIILMDVFMPEMDGLQATREIRAFQRGCAHRSIIIGLTGNASAEDRQQCLEAGMDDVLPKPFNIESMRAMLEVHSRRVYEAKMNRPETQPRLTRRISRLLLRSQSLLQSALPAVVAERPYSSSPTTPHVMSEDDTTESMTDYPDSRSSNPSRDTSSGSPRSTGSGSTAMRPLSSPKVGSHQDLLARFRRQNDGVPRRPSVKPPRYEPQHSVSSPELSRSGGNSQPPSPSFSLYSGYGSSSQERSFSASPIASRSSSGSPGSANSNGSRLQSSADLSPPREVPAAGADMGSSPPGRTP
eukprot:TRINITY_DN24297_c0_g1_i1.p1 TRINITY_DN24297_c0_g1~~TRINITY_DN24297_c0_g1_i1.p1  ORF type:complete len:758 (+),score=321.55 TRINITY_DN24297_c0_g1_i1:80-2353(+)